MSALSRKSLSTTYFRRLTSDGRRPSVFFRDMRDCGRAGHSHARRAFRRCCTGTNPCASFQVSASRHCSSNSSHSYHWHSSHSFPSFHSSHWLGDRVDFDLGVAAGVGVRLLHLSLLTSSSMLILVSCSNPGGTTTLCSDGVGPDHCLSFLSWSSPPAPSRVLARVARASVHAVGLN